jgi:DNA-binding transcriptional ArsR family regulator
MHYRSSCNSSELRSLKKAIVVQMVKPGSLAGEQVSGYVDGSPPAARQLGDVRENPVYRVKAGMFRTLGHPARLRLLELLGDGERTVGELQAALELDSSGVSQHLSALRRHGLLESRKLGTTVYCRLSDRRTLKLLSLVDAIVASRLQESRRLLDELGAGADAHRAAGGISPPAETQQQDHDR